MCKYQVLAQVDEAGYVVYCAACELFHVKLGSIHLEFNKFQLNSFEKEVLDHSLIAKACHEDPFIISAGDMGVDLAMSRFQFMRLYALMDELNTERKMQELLAMFG